MYRLYLRGCPKNSHALLQVSEIGLDTTQGLAGLLKLVYTYGASGLNNGNIQTQQIIAPGLNRTQYYDYDGVNRLEIASEGATISGSTCPGTATWCQDYGYDAYGNRWINGASFPIPSQSSHFTSNKINLGSVLHDSAGNLTRSVGGTETMSYDAESRMTSYSDSGMSVDNRTYGYDGEGRRVLATATASGKKTVFVYDAFGRLAAEYSETAPVSTGMLAYRTPDHLGSTRAVTDTTGAVTAYYDFKPFGERVGSGVGGRSALWSDDGGVKQQFTAKERDDESGLDYFGARYFSASLGRFTGPDKPFVDQFVVDPQSWNLYTYTRNNPLKYVDKNGDYIETAWDVANVTLGVASFVDNVRQGNYGSASLDAVGIVLDSAAVVAPLVPAGAGVLIKGARAADRIDDIADGVKTLRKS